MTLQRTSLRGSVTGSVLMASACLSALFRVIV
jgi:hypothetical protein